VLVTIGHGQQRTGRYIVTSSRMHETRARVSRAVAALEDRKLIVRASSVENAREMPLCLTKAGRRIYSALASLALESERRLLSVLHMPSVGHFSTL
jgi:DNA-binding MarR family transcriptional regulator